MTAQCVSIAQWEASSPEAGHFGHFALFDIRDPVEYERGHIPGASTLPRRRIEFRIAELVPDRDTPILVYGEADARAALAADTLASLGYTRVRWLQDGLAAWRAAGRALANGTNVPSKRFGEQVQHACAVPAIDAATLLRWQAEGRRIAVCDVRTPEEHAQGCIPQARSLPSFDIALHAADLARSADTVVLHCAGRTRSIIATRTLRELGIDNVVALENGTMSWRLAGHALAQGSHGMQAPPSPESRALAERTSAVLARDAGVRRIDANVLVGLLADTTRNRYVFDVRGVAEFEAGHIAGSIALPGGQAVQRADDFMPVRAAPIVLIDEEEARANLTGAWLRRMGFADVAVLTHGLRGWRDAGLPVARGRRPVSAAIREPAAIRLTVEACLAWRRAHPELLVIDVDTSGHFRRGHLPDARWIPRGWLELRIGALAPSTDVPVLVTCGSGQHAPWAAAALRRMGHAQVACLDGGTRAWAAAGQALHRADLAPQDDELLAPYERGEQAMRDYIDWEKLLVPLAAQDLAAPPSVDSTKRQR